MERHGCMQRQIANGEDAIDEHATAKRKRHFIGTAARTRQLKAARTNLVERVVGEVHVGLAQVLVVGGHVLLKTARGTRTRTHRPRGWCEMAGAAGHRTKLVQGKRDDTGQAQGWAAKQDAPKHDRKRGRGKRDQSNGEENSTTQRADASKNARRTLNSGQRAGPGCKSAPGRRGKR